MRQHAARPGSSNTPGDPYTEVTARIIAALEAGTPPWRQPWDGAKSGGPMRPHNAVTGMAYRGINTLILGMSPLAFMSGDPRWATYKQAAQRGWQVRKGERGTTAYFFKRIEVEERDDTKADERKIVPVLRAFHVFHASQVDGIAPYVAPGAEDAPWRMPSAAETIVRCSGAEIRIGGDRAFYAPASDHVQMPPPGAFRSADGYASVLLHELSHWTGSESRLNRDLRGGFGSADYAREELRAEIAQVMICAELGLAECEFTNGAAYVASWLARLRDDRKEIFRAASDAQRIADYLLAFHPEWADRTRRVRDGEADDPADAVTLGKAAA
jgi:antirestriction protein ArdC